MWTFPDKGGRECCLIPEVTGLIQDLYNESWSKSKPKPIKVFYEAKAYRYERPQAGRYREFTQFGVEILGPIDEKLDYECTWNLLMCLRKLGMEAETDYRMISGVKRGLGYYIEDGFEIVDRKLGAQEQVAGGGRYAEGIGWAVGVERLMLSLDK